MRQRAHEACGYTQRELVTEGKGVSCLELDTEKEGRHVTLQLDEQRERLFALAVANGSRFLQYFA